MDQGYITRVNKYFKIKRQSVPSKIEDNKKLELSDPEGLYAVDEGRGQDYKEKMIKQREIGAFVNQIFQEYPFAQTINFE